MPFDGFISYSHAADGRLAPAVQRGLHRLAKPWHRRRALWIFRDQTGLAVTPALWSAIQEALDGSKHFVLLASPEAARSPWVNREIEHWVTTKSPDRILPVVTDGEWRWDPDAQDFTADSTAVPAALRGVFTEEPLYLDLRWARDDVHLSLQHTRFRDAIAQLAAPMHGVSKDELEGEDVRSHRRARRLSFVAVATLLLLTLVASMTGVFAMRNADRANAAASEALLQQRVATEQRGTAERATEESERQQENARVQENRARDAAAETKRQAKLAQDQQALARDAAAEAKREQANAERYQATADRQKADAERQKAAAKGASEEAERQKANAEEQLANARQQQALANQATARAEQQEKLAQQYSEAAQQADKERQKQEKLAEQAAEEARVQREKTALQQRIEINRRLMARARVMLPDDPKKAFRLGVAAQKLHSDPQTVDQLSHLAMATNYAGALAGVVDVASVAGPTVATADAGGRVSLWNSADPARPVRIAQLPADGTADKTLAASSDGKILAVCDGRSAAALWDVRNPAQPVRMAALPDAAGVMAVTFSPDGHLAATSNSDKNTQLWDLTGTAPVALGTLPAAYPLQFSPDGLTGVTSGDKVTVWNLTDPAHPVQGAELRQSWQDPLVDAAVAFNPHTPVVAVEDDSAYVNFWVLTDPAKPRWSGSRIIGNGDTQISSMSFSPDGQMLALGDSEGATELWAFKDGSFPRLSNFLATLTGRGGPARAAVFSRDGHMLTTVGTRNTATLWYPKGRFAPDPAAELPGPYPGTIVGMQFRPDGRSLIVPGYGGKALPWDLAAPGGPVRRDLLTLSSGRVESVDLSRDGRTLVVDGQDKTVRLLDTTRPAEPTYVSTIPETGAVVTAVELSPDGLTLAIGRRDGKVSLWDLTNRKEPGLLATLPLRTPLSAVAFSPDGLALAVSEGYNVTVFDLSVRSDPQQFTSISLSDNFSSDTADSLAFSRDGKMLAAGTHTGVALLWDVADPAQPYRVATLTGHSLAIRTVAFTPDGLTLVTASWDNALMMWDIADPSTPFRFAVAQNPTLESFYAAMSPDGRTVAVGGDIDADVENVTLWDTTVPKDLAADPVRYACAVSGRGLSQAEWDSYIPELDYQSTC